MCAGINSEYSQTRVRIFDGRAQKRTREQLLDGNPRRGVERTRDTVDDYTSNDSSSTALQRRAEAKPTAHRKQKKHWWKQTLPANAQREAGSMTALSLALNVR